MSVSFDARDPTRTATRATVRQAGEIEALGEGVARFAAAQWPTKKDEDRVHVAGGIPGVCDAVVQLYDGHGGKHAARHCILEMPAVVEECFFNFRDTRKYINDRETLYGKVDDTGFHPRLDDAIVAAFERLDREVKAEDESGTTAAVIFMRKGAANVPGFAAGDIIVKCAWVGDSRAVMFRDGELSSLVDLSRDHKPECAREVARIRGLYNQLEGNGSFVDQDEALDASIRGGRANKQSPGGGSPSPRASSAENSARAGNKSGKKGAVSKSTSQRRGVVVENGLPEVEMTLGPSRVMEELVDLDDDDPVWDSAAEKSQSATPVAEVGVDGAPHLGASPAKQPYERNGANDVGPGAYRAQLSVSGSSQGGNDSTRSGMALEGVTEDTIAELRARHADQYDGDTTDEDVDDEGNARRGRVIQRVGSDPSMGAVVGAVEVDTAKTNAAATDAEERAARMADDLDNDEEDDVPAHALPVFNRSNASGSLSGSDPGDEGSYGKARMSFVGFYKNEKGQALSKPRIFSSSGMSHGVSRSIGDLGAARGCVATPEISTHRILAGGSARIVVCSDGVWDVFDSLKAMKTIRSSRAVDDAARKLCTVAREKREFSGISLDDISTIVVDVGEYTPGAGDAPACSCVVQ